MNLAVRGSRKGLVVARKADLWSELPVIRGTFKEEKTNGGAKKRDPLSKGGPYWEMADRRVGL